jgi:ribosomal protein S18 acetylase RimI-like enzyme
MNLQIVRANPEQADELSRIALAAKAYWGYPARWMQIWKPQLTFNPRYFVENESWVAMSGEKPIGFYTLQKKDKNAWLENLWVMPEFIGRGIGKALFLHVVELSRRRGYPILRLEADPNAFGFYEKMGMHRIGDRRYELEGQLRILPIMELKL